ncbi:MAG: efflux RND transporter periplasmic adaptor subunit [Bacteroidia bacterium]
MKHSIILLLLFTIACKQKQEKISPVIKPITESIYASGIIVSKNQYQAFATVSGIVDEIYVSEGDSVSKGTPILYISSKTQQLNKENARLTAEFSDSKSNQGKLNEVKQLLELSKSKLKNDSVLLERQKKLWSQNIGTKVELEQRELSYQNSKTNFISASEKYDELKRQLDLNANQSKNNLSILSTIENEYTLKSMINGRVYSLNATKGEIVTPQKPLAVIGDKNNFVIEMQVDENDIIKIKNGLAVIVSLNSYKNKVFDAIVTKVNPLMNVQNKTFLVEAEFVKPPDLLFPNITLEANIVIQTKVNALLIPREYLSNDSIVTTANGENVVVKTGLKDYQMVEIVSGITATDELIKSVK